MREFFRENNLTIGLIVSSVLLPLTVDYVKRRWDEQNWARQKEADDLREKRSNILRKRIELLHALTQAYVSYLVAARFVTFDASRGLLDSESGKQHLQEYDSITRGFFRDGYLLSFEVGQYFERGDEYRRRLSELYRNVSWLDACITDLLRADPKAPYSWTDLDRLSGELEPMVDEVLRRLAEQVYPGYVPGPRDQPTKWDTGWTSR